MDLRKPGQNSDVKIPPGMQWDDSHARTTCPDWLKVLGTNEEIALLFGKTHDPAPVELTDRIILNPFVAKRLASVLALHIRRFESDYGPLRENPDEWTPARQTPSDETLNSRQRAEFLLQLVSGLDVTFGFERSFKMSRNSLLSNRFLVGAGKKAIRPDPEKKIREICEQLDMPADLLKAFERRLPHADYIHFGYEENERTCVYKAYLEFYEKIQAEMKSSRPDPSNEFLLHLGCKWEPSDPARQVLTTYTWHPFLSHAGMLGRLSRILDPQRSGPALEIVKGIIGIAAKRVPQRDILYLEADEEGNPRKSFDINGYRANLQMSELYPFFLRMCRHYDVSLEQFHPLYDFVKDRTFGHISGGTDREGRDFLTVYYGVAGLQAEMIASGFLPEKARLQNTSIPAGSPAKPDTLTGTEKTDDKAARLFQLVNGLNVQIGFERSFKLLDKTLLADRFLLGFRTKGMQKLPEQTLNICRQLEMPPDFLAAFEKRLPESEIVLFGYEKNKGNRLYKAYLEFGDRYRTGAEPYLIHQGFKWNPADPSIKVLTRYACFPSVDGQDILKRVADVYYGLKHQNLLELVKSILETASARADSREFLYFEVNEADNPRASFDINMYRANLRMKELYPCLLEMVKHFAIPPKSFNRLYETMGGQIFGHLTGGVDREGRDFLTVYYGEKGSTRKRE